MSEAVSSILARAASVGITSVEYDWRRPGESFLLDLLTACFARLDELGRRSHRLEHCRDALALFGADAVARKLCQADRGEDWRTYVAAAERLIAGDGP